MFEERELNSELRMAPYFTNEAGGPNLAIKPGDLPKFNPEKGTTGLAMRFKDGVIIAADRRVSAGYYIASSQGKKIHKLTERIGIAISGLVSDAMALVELLVKPKDSSYGVQLSPSRQAAPEEVATQTRPWWSVTMSLIRLPKSPSPNESEL